MAKQIEIGSYSYQSSNFMVSEKKYSSNFIEDFHSLPVNSKHCSLLEETLLLLGWYVFHPGMEYLYEKYCTDYACIPP